MALQIKQISRGDLDRLCLQARQAKRLRVNHNLHSEPTDPIQRFLNVLEPGSYIRPHRHLDPPKWELLLVVQGSGVVLLFNEDGSVRERLELNAAKQNLALEISSGLWHTLAALEPNSVFFELKPGPYTPFQDKDFARWSSQEGTDQAQVLEKWFRLASPGDRAPFFSSADQI